MNAPSLTRESELLQRALPVRGESLAAYVARLRTAQGIHDHFLDELRVQASFNAADAELAERDGWNGSDDSSLEHVTRDLRRARFALSFVEWLVSEVNVDAAERGSLEQWARRLCDDFATIVELAR